MGMETPSGLPGWFHFTPRPQPQLGCGGVPFFLALSVLNSLGVGRLWKMDLHNRFPGQPTLEIICDL